MNEHYKKLDDIISKFKNGKELYKTSATFNRVVQMLARDVDPIEIIEQLIVMEIDMTNAFQHHIVMDDRPYKVINK